MEIDKKLINTTDEDFGTFDDCEKLIANSKLDDSIQDDAPCHVIKKGDKFFRFSREKEVSSVTNGIVDVITIWTPVL